MMSYHMILSYDMILENLQRTNTQTDSHTKKPKTENNLAHFLDVAWFNNLFTNYISY